MNAINNYSAESETLMAGETIDDGSPTGIDIRGYLADGKFLEPTNYTSTQFRESATETITATAINWLWKQQKVFILGGGPCNGDGNLGSGPTSGSFCMDGAVWYLYFWHEYPDFTDQFNWKKWGNIDIPPGGAQLGQGDYSGITIQVRVLKCTEDLH
jgi:hypothetical protein